jgi:Fe-S-cluster-containing hydrogenase component 2
MNRLETMTSLLKNRKFFKLVCGAGNEDVEEVYRLCFIYTLAGSKGFDVSANTQVVQSAMRGIDQVLECADKLNKKIRIRPFINVSIGMRGDPHIRKAIISDSCTRCGACLVECYAQAISDSYRVIEHKCIGCGNCESACNFGAVKFYNNGKKLKNLLQECKTCGAEQMELHAAVPDADSIFEEWGMINEIITDNYVSMCLDRQHLSDSALRRRIKKAQAVSKERLIIQADGIPMSGGKDDFNTTLQAVAIADIVTKSKLQVMVLLSGGTNSLTTKLARSCGVAYNGICIGTFARNLVKDLIKDGGFMQREDKIREAITKAERLVTDNIGEVIW